MVSIRKWIALCALLLASVWVPLQLFGDDDSDDSWSGEEADFYNGTVDMGDDAYHNPDDDIDDWYEYYGLREDYEGSEVYVSHVIEAEKALEDAIAAGVDDTVLESLQQAVDDAVAALDSYCAEHGLSYERDELGDVFTIYNDMGDVVKVVGDPVLLASGVFQIDDTDMKINVGKTQFSLCRHYMSDVSSGTYQSAGAFGIGWSCFLDSRIILGRHVNAEQKLTLLNNAISKTEDYVRTLSEYAREDPDCEDYKTQAEKLLEERKKTRDEIKKRIDTSICYGEKNQFVAYGYAGKMAQNLGIQHLILVDDSGNPIICEQSGSNFYPVHKKLRGQIAISYSHSADTYTVTYADGGKRTYDGNGLLQEMIFPHGRKITFLYNTQHKIERAVIDEVYTVRFLWDKTVLISVSDGIQTIAYKYEDGRLLLVRDADGDVKSFAYDGDGKIVKQIKPDGSFIAFGYETGSDGKERTVYTINENGAKETFAYDGERRRTTYTDHDGVTSWYEYDSDGHTTRETYANGKTISYTYDADGNVASRESMGNRTTYAYDEKNRKTMARYSDGSSERWVYAGNNLLSYTDRDGIVTSFSYDAHGNVTALYRGGKTVASYAYNAFGQVTRETDCRGNRTEYTYDAQGNCIKKQRFAQGMSVALATETWAYDGRGRVTSYGDARGISYAYQYATHRTFVRASNGYEAEFIYNNRKDLVTYRQKDTVTGEERIYQYEYDKCHNVTRVLLSGTDGAGKMYAAAPVQTAQYTGHGRIARRVIWGESDQFAYVYQCDDAGSVSHIAFGATDANGTLLAGAHKTAFQTAWNSGGGYDFSETNGDGRTIVRSYDYNDRLLSERDGTAVRMEHQYSAGGRLTKARTKLGGELSYAYDGETGFYAGAQEIGSVVGADVVACDADGKKAVQTNPTGNKTYYYYDAFGAVCKLVSDGKTEFWTRDGAGRMLSHTITSATGMVVFEEAWSYSADGRTKTHTKGGSVTCAYTTNAFGEIVRITDAAGNVFGFVYDVRGRCIEKADGYGKKTRFFYDGKNQLIKTIDRMGHATTYAYDAAGNCVRITNASGTILTARYDQSGRLLQKTQHPSAVSERYEYDGADRITKIYRGDEVLLQTIFASDGKQITRKDAKGKTSNYQSDGFGRILSETNRLGAVQTFAFKKDGALLQHTDFLGDKTTYAYDRASHLTTVSHHDGSFTQEERDAVGHIVRAKNQSEDLRFTYDTAGNVRSQYDERTGARITYAYDACGRRIRMQSEKQDVRYQYGKNGELTRVEDVANMIAVQFSYDAEGRETMRSYATGERTELFYDEAGRLILTVGYAPQHAVVFVEGTVYDAVGRKSLVLNTDFSVTRYQYDAQGRLASVQYPYSESLASYLQYLCAEAGLHNNDVAAVATENPHYTSAEYTALKALCAHVGAGLSQPQLTGALLQESFTYDKNGNLSGRKTPFGTISYQYDAEDRLVSWGNGCSARYDANGNLLEKKTLYKSEIYTYNKMNRMESVTIQNLTDSDSTEYTYQYDALGRRTLVSSQKDGAMRAVYDGLTFSDAYVTRERAGTAANDTNTQPSVRYVWLGDDAASDRTRTTSAHSAQTDRSAVAQADATDAGYIALYGNGLSPLAVTHHADDAARYALFSDAVGTVKATYRGDGMDFHATYDAFGAKIAADGWNPYGFVGKKSFGTPNLYDFGYRDYAADAFRFTTSDPARDGTNWYAYCNGDSVNYVDPWGLELELVVSKETQTMEVFINGEYIRSVPVTTAVVSQNATPNTDYSRTQNSSGHQTNPTQFPNGTYTITGCTPNNTGEIKYGSDWLRTDATQYLPDVETGELIQDGGYCIHLTSNSNTNGCVGIKSQEDMDFLAWSFTLNEYSDPNSSRITVASSVLQATTQYETPFPYTAEELELMARGYDVRTMRTNRMEADMRELYASARESVDGKSKNQ